MRKAKFNDIIRHIDKIDCKTYIETVNYNDVNGLPLLNVTHPIFAVCGLNGVGKTTMIEGIKDVLGIKISGYTNCKLNGQTIIAKVVFDNSCYDVKNIDGERLSDQTDITGKIFSFDYRCVSRVLSFLIEQENIEELISTTETFEFNEDSVREINNLIGKSYKSVTVNVMDEYEETSELPSIPFFSVVENDITYNTLSMGTGEYFLLYVYFYLSELVKTSTLLIFDEPETFIGIRSQDALVKMLFHYIDKLQVSIIIATHSPFILEYINPSYISMMTRCYGSVSVHTNLFSSPTAMLGLEEHKIGAMIVEDSVARDFLNIVLSKEIPVIVRAYDILIANGESKITALIDNYPKKYISYHIIAIYDDDQRSRKENKKSVWPILFLPPKKDVETDMQLLMLEEDNVASFASLLNLDDNNVKNIFMTCQNVDPHDWLVELEQGFSMGQESILRILYEIWYKRNIEKVNSFVKELKEICINQGLKWC